MRKFLFVHAFVSDNLILVRPCQGNECPLRAFISLTRPDFEHRNAFQKDSSHILANIRAKLVKMWIIQHSILKMKKINNVMVKQNESVYNALMADSDILHFLAFVICC